MSGPCHARPRQRRINPAEHLGLVHSVVRSITKHLVAADVYEDAVQDGMVALIDAARGYDPARGVAFATYASRCIRHAVFKSLMNRQGAMRLPLYRWRKGELPPLSCSFEQPRFANDRESSAPMYHVADERPDGVEAALFVHDVCSLIAVLNANGVDERLRYIIRVRYLTRPVMTLEQVGRELGLTKSRVQQLEAEAIGLMRKSLTSDRFRTSV